MYRMNHEGLPTVLSIFSKFLIMDVESYDIYMYMTSNPSYTKAVNCIEVWLGEWQEIYLIGLNSMSTNVLISVKTVSFISGGSCFPSLSDHPQGTVKWTPLIRISWQVQIGWHASTRYTAAVETWHLIPLWWQMSSHCPGVIMPLCLPDDRSAGVWQQPLAVCLQQHRSGS